MYSNAKQGHSGKLRAVVAAGLSLTLMLGGVPAIALEEMGTEAEATQEQVQQESRLTARAAEVASTLEGDDKLAALWDALAGVVVVAPEEGTEIDAEEAALAALNGAESTPEGVTYAFVAVAEELGFGAEVVAVEDGRPVARIVLDGEACDVDVANGEPGQRPWVVEDEGQGEGQEEGGELADAQGEVGNEDAAAPDEATNDEGALAEDFEEQGEAAPADNASEDANEEAEALETADTTPAEDGEEGGEEGDEATPTAKSDDATSKKTKDAKGSSASPAGATASPNAASTGLPAQNVAERTLTLNDQWHTFYPAGYGTSNACIYTFTLQHASRVQLAFQNWWNRYAKWELYNADMTYRFWDKEIPNNSPGVGSDYCYLKAGTYRVKVYPAYGGDSGYLRVKGSATAMMSYPTRDNDTFDKATSIGKDKTVKSLFTRNDAGSAYYKFTVSGTKTVKITTQENDANIDTLYYLYLYNSRKEQVDYWWRVGSGTVTKELAGGTYYVKLPRNNNAGGPYTVKWTAISDTVADASVNTPSYTYTGEAITPHFTVKLNGNTLREGVDYTVSHGQCVDAGWYNATIRGAGSYKGTISAQFQIKQASVKNASIAGLTSRVYTGKQHKPGVTVKVGGRTLEKGNDYTVRYGTNKAVGKGTVTVIGKGNYKDQVTKTFRIVNNSASVQYYVHRQTYGWEPEWSNWDGQSSGTTGESKRLEGVKIRLNSKPVSGSIQYRTHIQGIGWQGWKENGAMSGTSGQSKRLEAIRIRLTGDMAKAYDVYYRVHAQRFGWMGWAKNGASSGTAGYSYRLEAIQIVLVPKGGAAPGSTANAFRAR